jgi:putative heme-binding domain-containing protein
LWRVIEDAGRPPPIRLKALAALSRPNEPLSNDAFALLFEMLKSGTSPTARVDAARLLTRVRLSKQQILELAPIVSTAAPIELQQLLRPMTRKLDVEAARIWARELIRSPYFGSLEESVIRSTFQSLSADIYESILGPAVRAAAAVDDAKKRRLEILTATAAKGHAADGRKVFESGGCVACHKVGDLGRIMGPDLTQIGRIRQPRDLLEAILFPSATFARGFETHVIETVDGATFTGMIKSESAEGLQVVDIAGQEKNIPQAQIIGQSPAPSSLMPDMAQGFTDQQLLDLVAWLLAQK